MKLKNLVSGTIIALAAMSMTNVATADPKVGILFGSVQADCKPINVGTGGWTCKKSAKGRYVIQLKPKIPKVPVCQAAPTATKKDSAADDNVFTTVAVKKSGFMVESLDVAGNGSSGWAYQDASFNFVCMWMLP